jgi:hypothetical protein
MIKKLFIKYEIFEIIIINKKIFLSQNINQRFVII